MSKKAIILEQYDNTKSIYERFAEDIEKMLKRILSDEGISYNAITSRVKEKESLSKKIERKNDKYSNLSDLTDISGVRVISYYADDVDRIANIVEKEFVVDEKNSIDKRKALEPDRFGYCSVHYVVEMTKKRLSLKEYYAYKGLKCEIQIRSVLQHAWAEIEHDLGYKSTITVPRDIRRNFSRLAGLLEIADKEFDEIRQKLSEYKEEAEEKITTKDFGNNAIDAILLETLIDSNESIIEINNELSNLFGRDINKVDEPEEYEDTIKQLQWIGINTLGELTKTISSYKNRSIEIAKEFIGTDKSVYKDSVIRGTIAFFYLCYAVLLDRFDDENMIIKYLNDNKIGDYDALEEIAEELLMIKSKVY